MPRPRNPVRRRGFSFVEVMFAVVILGIGFIMVAAIFPVAIEQNQLTGEAASSSAFARVAASVVQQLRGYNANPAVGYNVGSSQPAPSATATYPAYVFPFDSTYPSLPGYAHGSYAAVAGSQISSADPRFAVVPLYSLSANGTLAQFYFFNVTVRNRPVYDSTDITPLSAAPAPAQTTLTPKLLQAKVTAGTPSLITFNSGSGSTTWASPSGFVAAQQCTYATNGIEAVGTGCYVLVANDGLLGTNIGSYNGKVYKVGNQRLDLNAAGTEYELAPGDGFNPPTGSTVTQLPDAANSNPWADVWIVGKGLQNHAAAYTAGTNVYTDAVQDVSFYTTFAPIQ